MREKMNNAGLSKEDEYFHRLDRERVEKRRGEVDSQRAEQRRAELKEKHWMRCPKCGHEMEEVQMEVVTIDRCSSCQGVFFDQGELELLLQDRTPEGLLKGLKRYLLGG